MLFISEPPLISPISGKHPQDSVSFLIMSVAVIACYFWTSSILWEKRGALDGRLLALNGAVTLDDNTQYHYCATGRSKSPGGDTGCRQHAFAAGLGTGGALCLCPAVFCGQPLSLFTVKQVEHTFRLLVHSSEQECPSTQARL